MLYIYEEMMKNSQSIMVKLIWLENFMSGNTFGLSKINAFENWGFMVRTGGPWDHKKIILQMEQDAGRDPYFQQVGEWEYSFDTWSNIHYGFVGSAAGFSAEELLEGAGLEQVGTNIIKSKTIVSQPGMEGFKQFDYPSDQASIQLGIYLWITYGINLRPENIIQTLSFWNGLNKKS